MRSEEERINPSHAAVRQALRIVGPCILLLGIVLMLIGFGSFFSSFGSLGGPPRYFWCAFLGMPVLFFGIVLCKFAFLGPVVRYLSGETSPVAKDTFNYMAHGTRPGVRSLASAVREGLAGERVELDCPECRHRNSPEARFCSQCGANLQTSQPCPHCGDLNESTAKFCDHCGKAVV